MDDFPVTVGFPVHWGEMDAFGHVNNARYFTWFESARIELFRQAGMATAGAPAEGPILASTRCDFLRPVTWPARVTVGTRITRVGTTSFTMEYRVSVDPVGEPSSDAPVARGEGVIVLVDYRSGRPVPISPELRAALERFT